MLGVQIKTYQIFNNNEISNLKKLNGDENSNAIQFP